MSCGTLTRDVVSTVVRVKLLRPARRAFSAPTGRKVAGGTDALPLPVLGVVTVAGAMVQPPR